jgi:hypothetical protein
MTRQQPGPPLFLAPPPPEAEHAPTGRPERRKGARQRRFERRLDRRRAVQSEQPGHLRSARDFVTSSA